MLDGAKALAMTVADLWTRPDVLAAAKAEFADTRPPQVRRGPPDAASGRL